MFIQTLMMQDETSMKFVPGRQVLSSGSVSFTSEDAGRAASPLAARLFDIPGVAEVGFDEDSIIITKTGDAIKPALWIQLKPLVMAAIMDHYMSGLSVLFGPEQMAQVEFTEEQKEILSDLKDLVETRIAPQIEEAGGKLELRAFDTDEGLVTLVMDSSGLSTPAFGTQIKIENTLKHFIPQVQRVKFERMISEAEQANSSERPGLQTEEAETIRVLLETRINPAIASHGGYISLIDIRHDTAYVEMAGGCQGCGMADATLKQGVAVEITRAVPSIVHVLDVTDHAGGSNPYFQGSGY